MPEPNGQGIRYGAAYSFPGPNPRFEPPDMDRVRAAITNVQNAVANGGGVSRADVRTILDWNIYNFRNEMNTRMSGLSETIHSSSLRGACGNVPELSSHSLRQLGIKITSPNMGSVAQLGPDIHQVAVATFPIKEGGRVRQVSFLIDPTFRQFLFDDSFSPDIKKIGTRMVSTPEGADITNRLLVDGHIELTPDVAKRYAAGFNPELSQRAGAVHRAFMNPDFDHVPSPTQIDYLRENGVSVDLPSTQVPIEWKRHHSAKLGGDVMRIDVTSRFATPEAASDWLQQQGLRAVAAEKSGKVYLYASPDDVATQQRIGKQIEAITPIVERGTLQQDATVRSGTGLKVTRGANLTDASLQFASGQYIQGTITALSEFPQHISRGFSYAGNLISSTFAPVTGLIESAAANGNAIASTAVSWAQKIGGTAATVVNWGSKVAPVVMAPLGFIPAGVEGYGAYKDFSRGDVASGTKRSVHATGYTVGTGILVSSWWTGVGALVGGGIVLGTAIDQGVDYLTGGYSIGGGIGYLVGGSTETETAKRDSKTQRTDPQQLAARDKQRGDPDSLVPSKDRKDTISVAMADQVKGELASVGVKGDSGEQHAVAAKDQQRAIG